MELKLVLIALLACFNEIRSNENIPFQLNEEIFNGVEEIFVSQLSDELKQKLLKRKDSGTDLKNLDPNEFSDSDKNELEEAIRKAFEPYLGDFAKELAQGGFTVPTEDRIDGNAEETVDHKKNEEEEEISKEKEIESDEKVENEEVEKSATEDAKELESKNLKEKKEDISNKGNKDKKDTAKEEL